MSSDAARLKAVKAWFNKEVLTPRLTASTLRSFLFQLLLLFVVTLLTSPTSILSILSPSRWFYLALMATCHALFALLVVRRHFSVFPHVPHSTVDTLTRVMDPEVIYSMVVHAFVSGGIVRAYLGIVGVAGQFNTLAAPCVIGGSARCLNESHFFLILSGVFTGICLWFDWHLRNRNLLVFEPIQQSGSVTLRRHFYAIVKESLWQSLMNMRWFLFFFVVFGHGLVLRVGDLFHLESRWKWDSTFSYFWLYLQTVIMSILLNSIAIISLSSARIIHFYGLKKHHEFPVEDKDCSLQEALQQDGKSLIKYLALQDFTDLTMNSAHRRQQLLQLSQPGGHPRIWNNVCNASLATIQEFAQDLSQSSKPSDISSRNAEIKSEEKKTFVSVMKAKFSRHALVSPYPDANVRAVFAHAQGVIWAVEALSQMTKHSILEDNFGIVQRDLGRILSALLNLQQTVERHKGLTINLKRHSFDIRDAQLKQELRSSIKSSLYVICKTFGESLNDVKLPFEFRQKIDNYMRFLEG